MSEIAVRVRGLGKEYRIGSRQEAYGTLRESITNVTLAPVRRLQAILRGQGAATQTQSFWPLKDVSFDVRTGEVVGVIGRNGAGKSTLLKILSRITEPTTGYAEVRGRVGSLLEVGTGFHPELSGRENIYLNGAILGMTRSEIGRKFDEIVEFSEIGKFIDTPVKRYSSGMYVRLAFAVAAHLEPEVLVVDEVLAVGDAAFQKKCLGRMSEVAKGGRTVLFVSHNMPAVTRLCHSAIHLAAGSIVDQGDSRSVVERYLRENSNGRASHELPADPERAMRLRRIAILDESGRPANQVEMAAGFRVQVEYDVNRPVTGAHVICFFHTSDGTNVLGTGDADTDPMRLGTRQPGRYVAEFDVPPSLLGEDHYSITVSLSIPFGQVHDRHESIASFEIVDTMSQRRQYQHRRRPGIIGLELPWKSQKVSEEGVE